MDIFVSPHNDDDALFGAFTCLRYRPKIITVLRSFVEATWYPPVHYETREAESAAAAEVLGCEYEQWEFPDNAPHWEDISRAFGGLSPERVWAPLPEEGGHGHHNALGEMVKTIWPQTVFYATYTHARGKTTTGTRISPEPEWVETKREAMACYVSQATHPMCAPGFTTWAIDEYLSG